MKQRHPSLLEVDVSRATVPKLYTNVITASGVPSFVPGQAWNFVGFFQADMASYPPVAVDIRSDSNVVLSRFKLDDGLNVRSEPLLMTYDVALKDQINARPAQVSLVLSWRESVPMRLSDLIRERVILEWDRRSDAANSAARPLVESAVGRDTVSPGARQDGVRMSRDDTVALALRGFGHNAFLVIVNDQQVTDLDAEIRLAPDTDITFVRLVPLVGG